MSILRSVSIAAVFLIGLYILNIGGFLKSNNPEVSDVPSTGTSTGTAPLVQNSNQNSEVGTSTNQSPSASLNPEVSSTTNRTSHKEVRGASVESYQKDNIVLVPLYSQTNYELSPDGIVKYSNVERAKKGLKPLVINAQLSISAGNKLQDIFKSQYFEHFSPSGIGVPDLAKEAKYNYVVVGENLALGTFGSNQLLLKAWMASPGHRENIIDGRFQDIGVAVGKGMFQGSMQWVAVQHFGKPISSCIQIDSKLKTIIDNTKAYLIEYQKKIDTLRAEIDVLSGSEYREKAEEYNDAVKDYNVRLTGLETDIIRYNLMATAFNDCIGSNIAK